jgi:chromosome segregation ATPase
MKLKNLRKKVRRLEARLEEGPKKLAKLKRKLEALAAAKARKAQKKAAARAAARQIAKSSTPTRKEKQRLTADLQVKPVRARGPTAAGKVKRKLNLSPERRAQLAAAMKARWAAKRAAIAANPQSALIAQEVGLGEVPPSA